MISGFLLGCLFRTAAAVAQFVISHRHIHMEYFGVIRSALSQKMIGHILVELCLTHFLKMVLLS